MIKDHLTVSMHKSLLLFSLSILLSCGNHIRPETSSIKPRQKTACGYYDNNLVPTNTEEEDNWKLFHSIPFDDYPRQEFSALNEWTRLDRFLFRYRGEDRIEWSVKNNIFRVNGRVIGIDFTNLTLKRGLELLSQYGDCIESVSWSNAKELPEELLQRLAETATKRLGVIIVDFSGNSQNLAKLRILAEKLDSVFYISTGKFVPNLDGLSVLTKETQISISVFTGNVTFFRQLSKLRNLRRLEIGITDISDLFPKVLLPFRELVVFRLRYRHMGGGDLEFLSSFPNLRKLYLENIGYHTLKKDTLKSLKYLQLLYLDKLPQDDSDLEFVDEMKNLKILGVVCVANQEISNKGINRMAGLRNLLHVLIDKCNVDEEAASSFQQMYQLQHLFLYRNSYNINNILSVIHNLNVLKSLSILQTVIDRNELANIARTNSIRFLRLILCSIQNHHLGQLTKLAKLNVLILHGNPITDFGTIHLKSFKQLKFLSLNSSKVSNVGMKNIAKIKSLRHLRLQNTEVGDDGIKHLTALPSLISLDVRSTKVTDNALPLLGRFKSLKKVNVRNTGVSKEEVYRFKKENPNINIIY